MIKNGKALKIKTGRTKKVKTLSIASNTSCDVYGSTFAARP